MTEVYKIPQYDYPKPKPSHRANKAILRKAKLAKREKQRIESKRLLIKERALRQTKGKLWHAYLLELENGMYYIGITGNVQRRFEMHKRGKGAKWTQIHRPIQVLEQRCLGRMKESDAAKLEDAMFDEFFPQYGYCLRGGGKCRIDPNW